MKFVGRLVSYAFQRTLVRTDIFAAVVTAIAPLVYYCLGRPTPADLPLQIATLVAIATSFVLLLRLLAAPYLLWRSDQALIADLRAQIDAPRIESQKVIRSKLAEERVELARTAALLATEVIEAKSGAECLDLLSRHRKRFALFFHEKDIREDWKAFENAAFAYSAGSPAGSKMADAAQAKVLMAQHRDASLPGLDRAANDLLCTLLGHPKETD